MRAVGFTWLVIAALGCSGSKRGSTLGTDLRQLPRVGALPLVGTIPERAELALAVRDPSATWTTLQGSPAFRALGDGLWHDAQALPIFERWRALQDRLSELAREPLPGLKGLLEAPAVVAWVPGEGATVSGWLYVAKVDEALPRVWAFARALSAVRPSARDVDLERVRGVPVRELSIGGGDHLAYALLGDRLLIASDSALLAESVGLALDAGHRALGGHAPFSDLEARASLVGFAVAYVPHHPLSLLPGVRAAELDGADLQLDLASALWQPASRRLAPNRAALLRIDLVGLDPKALSANVGAQAHDEVGSLLDRIATASADLDRGLFAQVVPWQAGLAVAVDAVRRPGPIGDRSFQQLAEALLAGARPAEAVGPATLRCSEDDEVCLVLCPAAVRLAWPGAFARAAACPQLSEGPSPTAQLALWAGGAKGGFSTEVHDGRGHIEWGAP